MNNVDKKFSILIVEDEVILNNSLEEKLLSEGFNVFKAFDGDEGLQLALKEHPDLILLDLIMPKVDGLTMLKNLRKDAWGVRADVIILTNISDASKVAEVLASGFGDINNTYEYLVKTDWSLDAVATKIKQRLKITE
jgi:DNA-binding response OmpR family regulator